MINVGIVDDSYFFLLSIKELLLDYEEVNIVFAYNSIAELEESLKRKKTVVPDIVLLDFQLAEVSGLKGIDLILEEFPDCKILMLSSTEKESDVISSIHKGAKGIIGKGSRMIEIYEAIKIVEQEGAYLSPTASLSLINFINKDTKASLSNQLSKRELDIVMQVKEGLSYKQMAERLNVTVYTINHHLKRIYQKLNVTNKSQLITAIYKNNF